MLTDEQFEECIDAASQKTLLKYLDKHFDQSTWLHLRYIDDSSFAQSGPSVEEYDMLFCAACQDDTLAVIKLILLGADVNKVYQSGTTCLHETADQYKQDFDTFKMLIAAGANANIRNAWEETVLNYVEKYHGYESGYVDVLVLNNFDYKPRMRRHDDMKRSLQKLRHNIIALLHCKRGKKRRCIRLVKYDRFIIREIALEMWVSRYQIE